MAPCFLSSCPPWPKLKEFGHAFGQGAGRKARVLRARHQPALGSAARRCQKDARRMAHGQPRGRVLPQGSRPGVRAGLTSCSPCTCPTVPPGVSPPGPCPLLPSSGATEPPSGCPAPHPWDVGFWVPPGDTGASSHVPNPFVQPPPVDTPSPGPAPRDHGGCWRRRDLGTRARHPRGGRRHGAVGQHRESR